LVGGRPPLATVPQTPVAVHRAERLTTLPGSAGQRAGTKPIGLKTGNRAR